MRTLKITKVDGLWVSGVVDNGDYGFQAKVFDEGSIYGINEGRVSKLSIWEGEWQGLSHCFVNYDRGWDIEPNTETHKEVYQAVIQFLEL